MERTQFTNDEKQSDAAQDRALLRFGRRTASPIWFKATGDTSSLAFRINATLCQLFPSDLPTQLARCENLRTGSMEDAGLPLSDVRSAKMLGQAVSRLVKIQTMSIGFIPFLRACGCKDNRLSVRRTHIPEMIASILDAITAEVAHFAPWLHPARIARLGMLLTEARLCLESPGVSDIRDRRRPFIKLRPVRRI